MSGESRRWCCDDCRKSFRDPRVTMAPMLHDHVWSRLAREDETLCGVCMFKRASNRHIKLSLADLRACPANVEFYLQHTPFHFSWFEFFAKDESEAPKNLTEWEKALRRLSPKLG